MLKFEIDASEIVRDFNLSKKTADLLIKSVLDDITASILYNWQSQAKLILKGTLPEYLNSLKWIESGKFTNTLVLMGKLPNMLENGISAFDMKEGLLRSSKVKIGKDGNKYITIPFRWANPSAIGSSSTFSGVLPLSVYNQIRNQVTPRLTNNQGGVRQRGTQFNASSNGLTASTRQEIATKDRIFAPYKHKSSIYQGIQINRKTYESATQNTYVSFRRVSINSDPNAFIHSGLAKGDFLEKAMKQIDFNNLVDNSVESFLNSNNLL
jgi:hypothetical protein